MPQLSLINRIPNMSLISQVPKMSLLPYASKMSLLPYLFDGQEKGPSESSSMPGSGIASQMMESQMMTPPQAQPTQSSMQDLLKLIGPSGWGTTDEGGKAMYAYPSSSNVPYAYGLPNMAQEVMTGELNDKQMAPNAPYTFPYKPGSVHSDLMDRYQSPFVEGEPRIDTRNGMLPQWAQLLMQLLPQLLPLFTRRR